MTNYIKEEVCNPQYESKVDLDGLKEMIDNGEADEDVYVNSRPTGKVIVEFMSFLKDFETFAVVDGGSVTTVVGSLKGMDTESLLEFMGETHDLRPNEFEVDSKTMTYRMWWD